MDEPASNDPRRVAVVGAGLAGLTAATELHAAGHDVVVWEKSRGAGGRTATRRGPDGLRFDHGASFLHDGDEPLRGPSHLAAHRLQLPDGRLRSEVVGEPAANAPAKALAARVDVRTGVRIGAVSRAEGTTWYLDDEDGVRLGEFDAVIVAAPAPQAAELLRTASPELAERADQVPFEPCWSVMVAWSESLGLPFTASTGDDGLAWAIADSAKPARTAGERWVLQAGAALSTELLEHEPDAVGRALLDRFASVCDRSLPAPTHLAAHRWRYARPSTPLTDLVLQDGTLLAAGDWCGGRTAGAATRSGRAAAAALTA